MGRDLSANQIIGEKGSAMKIIKFILRFLYIYIKVHYMYINFDKDYINWQYAYFPAGGTVLDSVQIQSDGLSLNLNKGVGVITLDEVIWSHQIRLDGGSFSFTPAPVPEPTTILLFGAGVVTLAGIRLREKYLRQTTSHEFQRQ